MIDVLVVDDDFHVAEINAAYVRKVPGFRVVGTAHTAMQAMSVLDGNPVDLLLLDHYLPDRTGLDLVRGMRQRGLKCDVIMVTAAQDVDVVETALRHGVLQYLVKPFSFDGLRTRLESYRQLRRTLRDVGGRTAPGQHQVDLIYGALRTLTSATPSPAKGWSGPTVDLICRILRQAGRPLSAQEVASRAKISRSTAQRYLRHLQDQGSLQLSLRYGDAGRPEHLYGYPG
ncbi:transcriptional regulatory protein [Streptomyces sulfonofaciens]|uniref:Transcriptional regulatory protein n=1 Tax=Streptomyces sulfonofaciens TaxID=68272 RepID=A0A919GKK0_9ACTN|nr:response regulator [Streptomyces sulfonofaciens]GHH86495.1 transcriptional regulatory protein [Streptomyces sulfonofaciens]